ncbi:MAG: ATP-dependent DNA helicase RecG [Patescibacteria group bacterium]|nr:ATP-dependent DNA helicase RecG [Patescibacteria group bacterium]
MAVTLTTPLSEFSHVTKRILGHLGRMGIYTVHDLLYHFPVRYEDFSEIRPIAELDAGEQVTIQGIVENVSMRRSWRRHMTIIEATISDQNDTIRAIWFNQPYLAHTFKQGMWYNFSGKVSIKEEGVFLTNPSFEFLPHGPDEISEQNLPTNNLRHTGRLVPIYPETRGLTSKGIRFVIFPILEHLLKIPDYIPESIRAREKLPGIAEALNAIHFPNTLDDALTAKRRFSFENLFLLQMVNLRDRMMLAHESAPAIPVSIETIKEKLGLLPYTLTTSQKKSLWEICQDIAEPHPMNRLLQGDVGSGKTALAAIAALLTSDAGFQAAFMAPTEILARQHYATFMHLLSNSPLKVTIALFTSKESKICYGQDLEQEIPKKKMLQCIEKKDAQIVIGTHALLGNTVHWNKLGLVVIDEQHRFGVKQRAALIHYDDDNKKQNRRRNQTSYSMPHFLSMSATPIPRTLTLTVFGDLDLSTITELPPGRKPIKTYSIPPEKRAATYAFIRKSIKEGRQVFVICPRIEKTNPASESNVPKKNIKPFGSFGWNSHATNTLEVKTVTEEYEKLSKRIFPDLRVAMLHGKMPAKKTPASAGKPTKESVMRNFREGKIDILVSTTVIEVGVDVPNATIMMIEGAERFGLAQLYQLRGRVGRGAHESYCFLFTDSPSATGTSKSGGINARLNAITTAKNGFELAEYDLKQRGPGEFLGTTQTGFPDIAMEALMDPPLISASREAAKETLRSDPELKKNIPLQKKLSQFATSLHLE